jgi:C4-dicarboxylate-binding protein DctP
MKRARFYLTFTISVIIVCFLCFPPFGQAGTPIKKTYRLTFATQMPLGHLVSRTGEFMAKRALELSNGKIKIKHFAGGTLFKDREIPEGVMSGGCSMGNATASTWAGHAPGLNFWDLSFAFISEQQLEKAAEALIPFFNEKLYAKGAKLLGFVTYGDGDGIGNIKRPLLKPSDLKGLKIRSFSNCVSATIEAAGGVPVVMSSAEVYIALQRGIIDGACSGTTSFVTRKWMEVIKYITIIDGMSPYPSRRPFPLAVNRDVWDGMEPAAQQIMMQVAKEAWEYSAKGI